LERGIRGGEAKLMRGLTSLIPRERFGKINNPACAGYILALRREGWKIRSLRTPHSGLTEQTIPEMIEHHKPECKQHNISANLLYNLFIHGLLKLNRNRVLPNTGFFISITFPESFTFRIIAIADSPGCRLPLG
jgi:hypothetical protein